MEYTLTPRTSYPPPLGHVVNKTPSPDRTEKCLWPTPPEDNFWNSQPLDLRCFNRDLLYLVCFVWIFLRLNTHHVLEVLFKTGAWYSACSVPCAGHQQKCATSGMPCGTQSTATAATRCCKPSHHNSQMQ